MVVKKFIEYRASKKATAFAMFVSIIVTAAFMSSVMSQTDQSEIPCFPPNNAGGDSSEMNHPEQIPTTGHTTAISIYYGHYPANCDRVYNLTDNDFICANFPHNYRCLEWNVSKCVDCDTYSTDELNISCHDGKCVHNHLCSGIPCVTPVNCVNYGMPKGAGL